MSGLLATWGSGDVWAWVPAKARVCVYGMDLIWFVALVNIKVKMIGLHRGDPTLPTGCNTKENWSENRSCTSSAQHNRVYPVHRDMGKIGSQPWGCESGITGPTPPVCHVVAWERKRYPPPSTLATYGKWRSWPSPLPAAAPEKMSPHLSWAPQWSWLGWQGHRWNSSENMTWKN